MTIEPAIEESKTTPRTLEDSEPQAPESVSALANFDWNVQGIVSSLRTIRNKSLSQRNRFNKPAVLPSRKVLESAITVLSAAMFPHRLGTRTLNMHSVDYFVGQSLDSASAMLSEQAAVELDYSTFSQVDQDSIRHDARRRVKSILFYLPSIREQLDKDILAAYENDLAANSTDEVLACYPGILALIHYRIAHTIFNHDLPLIARMISEMAHSTTGIDIHPGAKIGESFFIDHGTGVVIGETSVIGNRVRIHHGVTLGARPEIQNRKATLTEWGFNIPRHPIIEDDVTIYADATILGRVKIGKGSIIGGNVCLTSNVPPMSKVTQAQSNLDSFIEGAGI